MWVNLHLLFWLTMIPVTTAWAEKSGLSEFPTALYAFVLFMCATAYWLWVHFIITSKGKHSVLAMTIGNDTKGKLSLLIYAAAVAVSFLSTVATFTILVLMAALWFVPDSRIEKYLMSQDSEE